MSEGVTQQVSQVCHTSGLRQEWRYGWAGYPWVGKGSRRSSFLGEDLWETPRNRTENEKRQEAMGMRRPAEDLGIIRKVIVSHFWSSKGVAAAVCKTKETLMRPKRALTEVAGEKCCPRLKQRSLKSQARSALGLAFNLASQSRSSIQRWHSSEEALCMEPELLHTKPPALQ